MHATTIVPHDHANCHTSRTWPPANGDCGTRYETHCSCGWAQGAGSQEHADALAKGHVEQPELPVVTWRRGA